MNQRPYKWLDNLADNYRDQSAELYKKAQKMSEDAAEMRGRARQMQEAWIAIRDSIGMCMNDAQKETEEG